MKIPIKIDFKSNGKACKVLLNGETMATGKGPSIEFETPDLEPRRLQALTMVGEFEVEKLTLDGIDTQSFVSHGFVAGGHRGWKTKGGLITYYFQAPVWRWYIEWIQHDNSYFRKLSKNHQGFLPL
jgi:hypothetical protein|tara:strand:+ start:469 stop:846 length:378 start_codon:yes stop_codon:yes gene_type:complete